MELYRWLKLKGAEQNNEVNQIGKCHFPQYSEEFFKQLTAERRVIRVHRGFPKAIWEKDPSRNNEALDTRVYARAAASIYGLDRFNEHHWQEMEAALAIRTEVLPEIEKPTKKRFEQRAMVIANDPYL